MNLPKTIGMIHLGAGYPRDMRIDKEAPALLAAGYRVALLTEARGPHTAPQETTSWGLEIHRVPQRRPGRMERLRQILTNDFAQAESLIADFIRRVQPQALHVHDLPYVRTVQRVAARYAIPVVADFHENMPAAMYVYGCEKPWWQRPAYRWYNSVQRWKRWEAEAARAAAAVVVVVPEAAEHLVRDADVPAERITVVSNTDTESAIPAHPDRSLGDPWRGYFTAIYTGFYAPHRGLDTAIRAAGIVARQRPTFRLLSVGAKNEQEVAWLRDLARRSGCGEAYEALLWQSESKIWSYVDGAAVGLVPHNRFEHTETTIPHKLFHFMLAGKPVIVSDCAPLKRVVEGTGAGLVHRANDPEDLARALIAMIDASDQQRLQWGAAGRAAAQGEYHWRHDAARLVGLYRRLLGPGLVA